MAPAGSPWCAAPAPPGIAEGEAALAAYRRDGRWPDSFHYRQQETGNIGLFVARALGLKGPAYTIATACSSSGKIFASARRLIRAGMADAVVVGGTDTLCGMTLAGFGALEALSATRCNPFSVNRDGITIGEGAAAFLLSREPGPIEVLGVGETSDAHHPSAPDPEGRGARAAVEIALREGGLKPADIAYVNMHGTATPLNDAMESRVIAGLFGDEMPCGSTKGMTGHMLGGDRRRRSGLSVPVADGWTAAAACMGWPRRSGVAAPEFYRLRPDFGPAGDAEQFVRIWRQQRGTGARVGAMTACPYPIADLLPHAAPMVLLDRVTAWDDDGLTASVTITSGHAVRHAGPGCRRPYRCRMDGAGLRRFRRLAGQGHRAARADWGSCLAPGILPPIAHGSRPGRRWRYRCGACSLKPAWRCSTAKSMLEKQLARGPG